LYAHLERGNLRRKGCYLTFRGKGRCIWDSTKVKLPGKGGTREIDERCLVGVAQRGGEGHYDRTVAKVVRAIGVRKR